MVANYSLTIGDKYQKAKQKPYQDIQSFATYLKTLKDHLHPYLEEYKKQHFLAKIRLEIARSIVALEYRLQTREEMLEVAVRIEENYKVERLEEET